MPWYAPIRKGLTITVDDGGRSSSLGHIPGIMVVRCGSYHSLLQKIEIVDSAEIFHKKCPRIKVNDFTQRFLFVQGLTRIRLKGFTRITVAGCSRLETDSPVAVLLREKLDKEKKYLIWPQ
jgi:hypothetical protein